MGKEMPKAPDSGDIEKENIDIQKLIDANDEMIFPYALELFEKYYQRGKKEEDLIQHMTLLMSEHLIKELSIPNFANDSTAWLSLREKLAPVIKASVTKFKADLEAGKEESKE